MQRSPETRHDCCNWATPARPLSPTRRQVVSSVATACATPGWAGQGHGAPCRRRGLRRGVDDQLNAVRGGDDVEIGDECAALPGTGRVDRSAERGISRQSPWPTSTSRSDANRTSQPPSMGSMITVVPSGRAEPSAEASSVALAERPGPAEPGSGSRQRKSASSAPSLRGTQSMCRLVASSTHSRGRSCWSPQRPPRNSSSPKTAMASVVRCSPWNPKAAPLFNRSHAAWSTPIGLKRRSSRNSGRPRPVTRSTIRARMKVVELS